MKNNWTKFTMQSGVICGYRFDESGEVIIKIFSKIPRSYYYSFLNDAGDYFDETIKPKLQ